MFYRRLLPLALLSLALLTSPLRALGAADDAATEPASDPKTFGVYEVTGPDGKSDLRPMEMDQVRPTMAALDAQYTKAMREWSLQEDAFYKDTVNANKVYAEPKPSHPSIKEMRSRLTQDQATRVARQLREEAIARKKKTFYRSMLGVYQGKKGAVPFVSLGVPNGRNIANKDVIDRLEGKVELPLRGFTATGKINIAYTGQYVVDSVAQVMLDDKSVGGAGRQTVVHLEHGTYTVKLTAIRGSLANTRVSIRPEGSNAELPIYNSEADIENFLATRISDTLPTELSGWIKVDNGPVAP